MSRGTQIGDAYVNWVNNPPSAWPAIADSDNATLTWTAVRLWDPDVSLEALQDAPLIEAVVMTASASELIGRDRVKQSFVVGLAVRDAYAGEGRPPTAWYDARASLVEAIANASLNLEFAGVSGWPSRAFAVCESAAIDDVTEYRDVQEKKAFVAMIATNWTDYRMGS